MQKIDSLVHDAHALRFLVDQHGSRRIALGSDYPFPLGEQAPGHLIRSMADPAEDQRRDLLGGTALEFLGLDRGDRAVHAGGAEE